MHTCMYVCVCSTGILTSSRGRETEGLVGSQHSLNSVSFSGILPGEGGRFQRCLSLVQQPVKRPLIPLHIIRTTKLEMAPRDAVFGLRSECRENTTQGFGRIYVGFVGLRLRSFCFLLLKRVQGDYFRLGEFSAAGGGGCQLPFWEEHGDKGSIEMLRCLSLSHKKTSWAQSQGRGERGLEHKVWISQGVGRCS